MESTDFDQKIEQLSGGQKRRVVLAKILAGHFDVLLLDEPTNHLDQEMITWLEEYLRSYRGTVLMVTHDRYFLDRVTNRILELSHGKMYGYDADYTGFLELKAAREERELATDGSGRVYCGWNWNGRNVAAGQGLQSRKQGWNVSKN